MKTITLSHKAWRSYTSIIPPEEKMICSIVPSGLVLSTRTNSSGKGSSSSAATRGSTTWVLVFFKILQHESLKFITFKRGGVLKEILIYPDLIDSQKLVLSLYIFSFLLPAEKHTPWITKLSKKLRLALACISNLTKGKERSIKMSHF